MNVFCPQRSIPGGISSVLLSALGALFLAPAASAATLSFVLPNGSVVPSTLDRAYVQLSGGTMSGVLNLPSGGLTVGTNQLTVNSSGNIGIGTASPQSQLSLTDGMNIDQADKNDGSCGVGSDSCLRFGSGSGEAIASERLSGTNQYGLDFYAEFTARMQISSVGNMSLNLSSSAPIDSGIQINGSIQDMGLKLTNSGTSGVSWYIDSTSQGSGYGSGSLAFTLAGKTPTMILTSGNPGNVGIGTNTPAVSLDVNGTLKLLPQPSGASPVCNSSNNGTVAISDGGITSGYLACVCNGSKWVELTDGSTDCSFVRNQII